MVAVVTDSAANLPIEVAEAAAIRIVPLYLSFGDRVYRDGVDLAPSDFYRRLASDGVRATTSTPTPADFLDAFRATGDRDVVCVTVAGTMSASSQEATAAKGEFDGRVEVVDSLSASMAQGFVALEAARRAATGADLGAVAARAREVAHRTRLYATVDTFDYLRRSGRVRTLQAYAATMLDIKPVFAFRGGVASAVARPRTRRRALARVVEETVRGGGDHAAHLAVLHAGAEPEAIELLASIESRMELVERFLVEVTPVIGAHTGPGLVGTAFFCD
jgi:DegV family protein with EDD domain